MVSLSLSGGVGNNLELLGEPLLDVTERGRHFLDRLELPEAEEAFREVLLRLGSSSSTPSTDRLAVESLFGLGEVYSRLSRHVKHSDVEWLRRMFHSLLLYRQAMDMSRQAVIVVKTELEDAKLGLDSGVSNSAKRRENESKGFTLTNLTYFQQIAGRSFMQVKLIEECLMNQVKENVIKFCMQPRGLAEAALAGICVLRGGGVLGDKKVGGKDQGFPGTIISEPGTIYPTSAGKSQFDGGWLHDVLTRSVQNPALHRSQVKNRVVESNDHVEVQSEVSRSESVNVEEPESSLMGLLVQQTKCKINFEMVQEAIKRLVSQVSTDVWSKYDQVYRRVPRALIEKRLASELIMRLSPGSQDNQDLVSAFEEAILFEDDSEYLEFQSMSEGSINGEFNESQSSFIFDRNSSVADSEFYESGSEDEGCYETVEVAIFPCATHTLGKQQPLANRRNASGSNLSDCSGSTTRQVSPMPPHSPNPHSNSLSPGVNSEAMRGRSPDGGGIKVESVNGMVSRSLSVPGQLNLRDNSKRNASSGSLKDAAKSVPNAVNNNQGGKTNASSQLVGSNQNLPVSFTVRNALSGLDELGRMFHGILSVWKPTKSKTEAKEFNHFDLNSIEELSALTEKDRSLKGVKAAPDFKYYAEFGESLYLNEAKLCQTVGFVAMRVGDSLDGEGKSFEACELFKYALGLFLEYPLEDYRIEVISDLILNIGKMKCNVGEAPCGVQLLNECVALYGDRITTTGLGTSMAERRDMFRVSEILYQQGSAVMADSYRQDLLMAKVMMLARREADGERDKKVKVPSSSVSDVGSSVSEEDQLDDDDDDEEGEDYSVCNQEAIACYKHALDLLERLRKGTGEEQKMPLQHVELYISVLSNLGDCYVISGHLECALELYERTLQLFQTSPGGNSSLLSRNAHVLSMIGTLNFLSRNWIRAATMYETSHVLRQHMKGIPDDPTLEMAWTLCMLSLSYFMLEHFHKCVVCSIRAFALYVRLYGGRILDVDPLGHWFVVQTLYMLGFAYLLLKFSDKALSYLTLCKNMATRSTKSQDDERQIITVLTALADTYNAQDDCANATKYYQQALEYSHSLGDTSVTESIQNQLMGHDVSKEYMTCEMNQKNLETSIKDDMVALLQNLGVASTLTCDIDRAIGCYSKCVQAFDSEHERGADVTDITATMANLGTLCQVKGCLKNDESQASSCFQQAERYFQEAISMSMSSYSPISVQYANFKYQRGDYHEALLLMLPFVFCRRPADIELVYHGIEQAVLPIHLHHMTDESLVLEARSLARFLAILCYNQVGLTRDAESALVQLYASAESSRKPANYSMLAYGCLELGLVDEAMEAFCKAARMLRDNIALEYWLCVLVRACKQFKKILGDLYGSVTSSTEFITRHHAAEEKAREQRQNARKSQSRVPQIQLEPEQSYIDRLSELKADTVEIARTACDIMFHPRAGTNASRVDASMGVIDENDEVFTGPKSHPTSPRTHLSIAPEQNLLLGQKLPINRFGSRLNGQGGDGGIGRVQPERTSQINDRLMRIGDTLKSRFGATLAKGQGQHYQA